MTDYNDGKWHGWNGGECPVHPRSKVDVMLSDGSGTGLLYFAKDWSHCWGSQLCQIIAFRVVKEHKEPVKPREFWVKGNLVVDDKLSVVPWESMSDWIHVREVL